MPPRMIGPRRPSGAYYKKRPATRKPRVLTKPAKKQVTAIVKRAIAAENETKFCSDVPANQVESNSSIVLADMIRCLPKLVQDEGKGAAYQRLGTKVSPKSLSVHCNVSLTADLTRSMAVTVFWFILESKRYKNLDDALTLAPIDRLMRTGNGQEYFNFDGDPMVANLPVNTTEFRVIRRGTFNLSKNTGTVQDNTDVGNQPIVHQVGHAWTVRIPTPKRLVYEQDEDAPRTVYYPNNFAPFLVCGYIHQDQSLPDRLNLDINVSARTSLWYDDS